MNLVFATLLLGVFLFSASLRGDGLSLLKFNPTPVGKGPALVFKQPKRDSDELALYLFDPAMHEKPQVIWQDRYHPNPRPLKRLSAEVMLIEFQNQLHLVDLPTGAVTTLLPGKEQNKLVVTEGKKNNFVKRIVLGTSGGLRLTSGKGGKTVGEPFLRHVSFLYPSLPRDSILMSLSEYFC
jgi:hypothetical protein